MWNDRFASDVEYVDNRSLALDLRIVAKTVRSVLQREGISSPGEATMAEFMGDNHEVAIPWLEGIVIFGCGGQGREIAGIAMRVAEQSGDGPTILGFVDDDPTDENVERVEALGFKVLGKSDFIRDLPKGTGYLVGIADGAIRERLATDAELHGLTPLTLQHPDATVGPACRLGTGTVLWPGARLTTNVKLGRHVHVNQNVTIGHDTVAEDFATINPSAAVSGSVRLGPRCLVGSWKRRAARPQRRQGRHCRCERMCYPRRRTGTVVKGVPAR